MPPRLGFIFFLFFFTLTNGQRVTEDFSDDEMSRYRLKVRRMFYHAYNGYLQYAYPMDELKPLSCQGQDTWGSFSLTLVDALDTLLIMGNVSEFKRASALVLESVRWDADVNVSVFETNIRVVGGLLTAHMLQGAVNDSTLEGMNWPCDGPLLRLAHKMAERLLPAFDTNTGMPYGTVNLKYGVHKDETPVTCTAGVGTFIVEFGTLSRLTGDERFEKVAIRALESLWKSRSPIGLVGNHVNIQTAQWTATDAGIGAGVDSYFEYLVKGAQLFRRPRLMKQFNEYEEVINKHIRKGDWFAWVSMTKATVSLPIFQSLEAFWPGILAMVGKVSDGYRIMMNYAEVIRKYGFPPEFYRIQDGDPQEGRAAFPLRPEMAESLMYLYRATGDPSLLRLGAMMVDAIESSARTRCGYATVHKVHEHTKEDRMESFFLAETTKYLYLLFDTDNFIHNDGRGGGRVVKTKEGSCVIEAGGYIFNTEAHPLDPSIIHCCSIHKKNERASIKKFVDELDFGKVFEGMQRKRNVDKKIKILDLPSETLDLAEDFSSDYIKQHYGSEDLEYKVDETMKNEEERKEEEEEEEDGEVEEVKEEEEDVEEQKEIVVTKVEEKEEKEKKTLPSRKREGRAEMSLELGHFEWEEEEKSLMEQKQIIREVKEMLRKARFGSEDRNLAGIKGTRIAPELIDSIEEVSNEMLENLPLRPLMKTELKRSLAMRAMVVKFSIPMAECHLCCRLLDRHGDSLALQSLLATVFERVLYPRLKVPFLKGPICWKSAIPRNQDEYSSSIPDMTRYRIRDNLPAGRVSWEYANAEWRTLAVEEWELLSGRGHSFEERIVNGLGQILLNEEETKKVLEEKEDEETILLQTTKGKSIEELKKEDSYDARLTFEQIFP